MAPKSQEQREKEVENLMNQFLELGISIDHPSTQEFIKITKEFAEKGYGASGILKFPEYNRDMHYILSTQSHILSRIILKDTNANKPKISLVRK
jgi:hypothetical protein